jgi:hypothetical protein
MRQMIYEEVEIITDSHNSMSQNYNKLWVMAKRGIYIFFAAHNASNKKLLF